MPVPNSVEKVGDTIVRFKTARFGLAVYRVRYTDGNGTEHYSRPFYFGKTTNGKLTRFPLGIDSRTAEKLAEEIAGFLSIPTNTVEMAIAKYNPKRAARASHVPTFAEILEHYKSALAIIGRKGGSVGESTFKGYRSFLATALRKVECYRAGKPFDNFMGRHHVDYSEWFDQPIDILTAKFAMDFKLASMPPPPEGEEEPDEEEILSAKITVDTTLRSVRALFSKAAIRYYRQVGLNLPDLSEFMAETGFGAKKYFMILPPEVIVKVMRASLTLRADNPPAYRAFLLCMHCGLRRGEAIAFRKEWLREEDRPMLYVYTKGKFLPKHGTGRKVAIEQWVFDVLKSENYEISPEVMDYLNDWAKALIPVAHRVSKSTHELRKCWVSFKAKSEGLLAAQQQAGHKDSRTTSQHYADSLMPESLLPWWKDFAKAG